MERIERSSAWERLGPFGQFLVGAVIFACFSFAAVGAVEAGLALTVRVPTVDELLGRP